MSPSSTFNESQFRYLCDVIADERHDQIEEHGDGAHTPLEWQSILLEEVGELAKLCTRQYVPPLPDDEYMATVTPNLMKRELVQIAAVAVAWWQQLDNEETEREAQRAVEKVVAP